MIVVIPSGFLCLLNHLYGIPNPLNYVHAPSSSVPSAVHFPSPWYIAVQDAGKTPLPERPPHNQYPLPCAGNASSAGSPESSHQIKRMFEAVGMQVLYLKRLRMGPLYLDESLACGEYRKLTTEEIQSLKNREEW